MGAILLCEVLSSIQMLWLQNMFKTGAVMVFISNGSGKALRVLENGDADGRGTEEEALGTV